MRGNEESSSTLVSGSHGQNMLIVVLISLQHENEQRKWL